MASLLNPLLDSPEWQVLAAHEAALARTHFVWHRESIFYPIDLTEESRNGVIAGHQASAKQRGLSHEEGTREALAHIETIEKGFVSHTEVDLVKIGSLRKATLFEDDVPSIIEVVDDTIQGTFSLTPSLGSEKTVLQPEKSWQGGLVRRRTSEIVKADPSDDRVSIVQAGPMDRSAPPGIDILLMQMSVMETFPPESSQWQVGEDSFILTTRRSETMESRLTLSKTTGCPISLENIHPATQKVSFVYLVTQTQTRAGIEVPAEIVSYFPSSGSPEKYHDKYQVIFCQIGEDVNDGNALLPKGMEVSDWRLSSKSPIVYRTEDGKWLTEAELKKLHSLATLRRAFVPLAIASGLGLAAYSMSQKKSSPRDS